MRLRLLVVASHSHLRYQSDALRELPTVYVCVCNSLTDRDVCEASAAGASRPAEILAACDCRAQCGTCARTLRDIARNHLAQMADAAD